LFRNEWLAGPRWYGSGVRRVVILLIVLVCAMQSTEILAFAVPDGCADEVSKYGLGGEDDCQTGCARCLCCARRSLLEPTPAMAAPSPRAYAVRPADDLSQPTKTSVQDVFHVPKHTSFSR
jgi:hypothetical protein